MTMDAEAAEAVAKAITRARDHAGANDDHLINGVLDALRAAGWGSHAEHAEALRAAGWGPYAEPRPGFTVYRFEAPTDLPAPLGCLHVMVRAWLVSSEKLAPSEKDRCIAFLVSMLQSERRSQPVTVHGPVPPIGYDERGTRG
jgi:hypothetical protein